MKTCKNCGKRIKENSKFCPHCGTMTEDAPSGDSAGTKGPETAREDSAEVKGPAAPGDTARAKGPAAPGDTARPKGPHAAPGRPGSGRIWVLAAAAVAVIAIVIFLIRPKYITVSPAEYVRVTCKGLDGEGTARLAFDADTLKKEITDEANLKPAQQNELESLLTQAEKYFSLSVKDGLSNGDSIAIQCEMPKDYLKDYRVKIKNSDYTYTVSGLTDVQTVKLEDYVDYQFYGFEKYGYAGFTINYDQLYADISEMVRAVDDSTAAETFIAQDLYDQLFYQGIFTSAFDRYEGLSNGDKVNFTCSASAENIGLEKYGIVFEEISAEQEVEGLEALETLDITPYIQVEFEGYDEAGTVSCTVDSEKLAAALEEKFPDGRGGYTPEDMDYLADSVDSYIRNYMERTIEPSGGLSNGDSVQIRYTGEEEENYVSSAGIIVENVDMTVTVEGLGAQTEADLMDMIDVTFSGITPDVSVSVSVDEESPLYPYVDTSSIWDIPDSITAYGGDKLTVTLEYYEEDALRNGYKIVNNSKEYEISGLPTYDFTLEDTADEKFAGLLVKKKEQTRELLLREESYMLEEAGETGSQPLWNRMRIGLDRILKCYSEDSYNHSRMVLVYQAVVPVMRANEQIAETNTYVLQILDNVSESDGGLEWEYEDVMYFYHSEEGVDEALQSMEEDVWAESSCEWTEAVNEDLEKELAGNEATDTEDAEDAAAETAAAATEAAAAPEISQAAQAQAVASVELAGHRYYLFDEAVTWQEAKKLCEQEGAVLATVTSWPEQAALQYLIQQGAWNHYWLGGSDEKKEGSWQWVTGEEFSYSCWDGSQPDNDGGVEDYLTISRSFGNCWNDYPSDHEEVGYILEVSAGNDDKGLYLTDSRLLRHEENISYHAWAEDSYGNLHFGAIYFDASDYGWQEYELDGAYDLLTGEISVYSEAASGASFDAAIFGDGELLWSKCGITQQTGAIDVAVDLSGVRTLTIETRNLGEYSDGLLILDGAKLYREEEAANTEQDAYREIYRLSELYVIDGSDYSFGRNLCRDTSGQLHENYLALDAQADAEILCLMEGKYTEFTGNIVTFNATGADVSMSVSIYGDEELLFTAGEIDKTSGQIPFAVDVSGVNVLRIETKNDTEGGDTWLYVTDDRLTAAAEDSAEGDAADSAEDIAAAGACSTGNSAAMAAEDGTDNGAAIVVPPNVTALASASAEYDSCSYFLIETPSVWKNAQLFCEQMGGRLAVADTPLAQARIRMLLRNATGSGYWLGASDEATEGEWIWLNGEAMTYTNWSSNNPDNYNSEDGGENYLEIYRDGTWNDAAADETRGLILEFSAGDAADGPTELAGLEAAGSGFGGESFEYQWSSYDVHGEVHLSNYYMEASDDAWLTCALNGAYETIRGSLVPAEDSSRNANMNIAVFGDGRLLYVQNDIEGWAAETAFEADVTGVRTLIIRTSNTGDWGELLLSGVLLDKASEPSLSGRSASLSDLQLIDSSGTEHHVRLFRDSYGNNYDGDWSIDTSEDGYALWLLEGAYTEVSGVLTASSSTSSESEMSVRIYADEELIFEADNLTRRSEPLPFTLDVTGANNLKIETDNAEDVYDGYLYVTEDALQAAG